MRTTPVIGVVLSLGVAFALLAGSGIGPAVFGESPGDAESASTLEDIGEESDVSGEDGGGVNADVAGDNEPTLVGFALSGGQFIVQTVGAVALLPITLTRLGLPNYFAVPVGAMAQIIATIGLFQFLRTGELI
jgi:hypothetical protein